MPRRKAQTVSTKGRAALAVRPIVVSGKSVEIEAADFTRLVAIMGTPSGDNIKREILTKFFPEIFGVGATLPRVRAASIASEAQAEDATHLIPPGTAGSGLASATCGHAAIEGGKIPAGATRPVTLVTLSSHPRATYIAMVKEGADFTAVGIPLTALAETAGVSLVTVIKRIERIGVATHRIDGKAGQLVTVEDGLLVANYTNGGGGIVPHKKGEKRDGADF